VGAGYADGLPRLLSNRGEVTIGNRRYPIVGTVCMDMFMVDVGIAPHVSVGDEVVLFGPEGPDAFQVAEWAETIPYEILTGVAARVPRLFVS
jgi:alanine racemase